MSERLFEADDVFIPADISAIFRRAYTTDAEVSTDEAASTAAVEESTLPEKGDWRAWSELLKTRIESNKKLSPDAQYPEAEIEAKFFTEYFETNWDKTLAVKLNNLGDPLKKAIIKLGFNPNAEKGGNPILGFLVQDFAAEILAGGLLNANTFRAIYNAVAKKLVADSQFFKENNYNIIYCLDLYRKTAGEIEKYLELQKNILKVSSAGYTKDDVVLNKKVFLNTKKIAELDPEKRAGILKKKYNGTLPSDIKVLKTAILNSLDLAKEIRSEITGQKASDEGTIKMKKPELQNLANKIDNTPAAVFAALQYISLTTGSEKATAALSNPKLKGISSDDIALALKTVRGIMPKGKINSADADILVGLLLGKI